MKTVFPNYNESITNLSNSILKHFDCETYHNTLPFIDKILDKDFKNVIVILCDGMGTEILDESLDKDSFLIQNRVKSITSVFPPTTTAATTSMLSGLNPNEHGWLGWDMYFKKENKTVTMYLNTEKDSGELVADYNIAKTTYPYENIINKINEKYEAYGLYSFQKKEYKSFDNEIEDIIDLTKKDSKKFIYAYYENPDDLLHEYGIDNTVCKKEIQYINNGVEHLCNNIEDSVVIVIADHGHINCKYYNLDDYPSVKNLLERTTSIEPRAVSFKVKENNKEEFVKEFKKYFGKEFILLSQNDIVDSKLFGEGINNPHFEEAVGDFIAISKSDKCIIYSGRSKQHASTHAGLTDKEMLIPVVVKEKQKTLKRI